MLEVAGDGGGEGGFAGGVAVSGVLPVGEDEDGVRLAVLQAEGYAFLGGAEVGAGLAEFAEVVE